MIKSVGTAVAALALAGLAAACSSSTLASAAAPWLTLLKCSVPVVVIFLLVGAFRMITLRARAR